MTTKDEIITLSGIAFKKRKRKTYDDWMVDFGSGWKTLTEVEHRIPIAVLLDELLAVYNKQRK